MTSRHVELVALAEAMGLSAVEAVTLPTVVDVAAGKVGMSAIALIAEARRNAPLRSYLRGACQIAVKSL